ncbi:MAG: redoxin domain-containing protein [Verrucomicrobia bacterium]|nr:redoxin domain-containing protein [Verrucomicrobiota bacterium]
MKTSRLSAVASLFFAAAVLPLHATDLGDPAPALSIASWVKGKPVILADGNGKNIYVVEFWATWCPPCRASIPHLTELQKKFKDKVVFVGVTDEEPGSVKPFVEKMAEKMDYNVAIDKGGKTAAGYMEAFGINGIPHAFVVDKTGVIAWQGHPMGGLEKALEEMVAGKYDLEAAKKAARAEKLAQQYVELAATGKDPVKAAKLGDQILTDASKNAELLNGIAWFILTEEKVQHRDLALAMRVAKAAYVASEGKDASIVDTYARAHFDTGKKEYAIKLQKQAIELCKDAKMKADLEETLARYQKAAK